MAFLDKYVFQVIPAPSVENDSKIQWKGYLDDSTQEIVIYDNSTSAELFRIGGGGAGVAWILDGNTEGSEKSLGTLDAFDLPFVTDGSEHMRIMSDDGRIGVGTAAPDPSARFDIASTTQGLLVPRMSTLQRNAIAAPGTSLLIYNTGTSLFNYWDGIAWQEIDSNATSEWLLDGNTNGAEKYIGTNDTFDLPIYTDGVERMRILASNGNVGIGTSPVYDLDVTKNKPGIGVSVGINVKNIAGNGFSFVQALSDNDTNFANLVVFNSAGGVGTFYDNNSAGLSVNSPLGLLVNEHASGGWVMTAGGYGAAQERLRVTTTQTTFRNNDVSISTFGITPTARLHVQGVDATAGNFALKVDNVASGPLLYVRNDGNVGIGIAAPTSRLHVVGATSMLGTPIVNVFNAASTAYATINDDGNIYLSSPQFTGFQWQVAGSMVTQIITTGADIAKHRLPTDWTWTRKTDDFILGGKSGNNWFFQKAANTAITPTSKVHIEGENGYDQLRLQKTYTPANSADANGNIGDFAWDDDYIYTKVSTGWKRADLVAF